MAFKTNIVPGHEALLDEVRRFALGWPNNEPSNFSGVGSGSIYLRPVVDTAPLETWTVTCTDATTPGAEVWSVVGSTSGAQSNATTGVAYDNGIVAIDIEAGLTNFAVNDAFTTVITAAPLAVAERWTQHRWDLGVEAANQNRLIMEGPGLSGTEQIFVGIRSYFNEPSDWYNIGIDGFTGYNSGVDYTSQPGVSGTIEVPLFNQSLEYWLAINGQRIVCAVKVETVFNSFYLGKFFPYASPGEFAYPVVAIGMTTTLGSRYSATNYGMGIKGDPNPALLRRPDGVWENVKGLPYADNWVNGTSGSMRDTPADTFPLIPIVLASDTPNIWGELDGVFYVPGFNNVVEDTITIGADTYIVIHDVFRTGFNDYFALKMA